MNILRTAAVGATVALVATSQLAASGPVGIYGIVERVVFEPNAAAAERVQIWGVFAYADGDAAPGNGVSGMSPAERGYLYFTLPDRVPRGTTVSEIELVRREWADLAAIAGTGQAVAFGRWGYIGPFADLHPGRAGGGSWSAPGLPQVIEMVPGDGAFAKRGVRPASQAPIAPAMYRTNAGIVKLSDRGSHAEVVADLRAALVTKAVD